MGTSTSSKGPGPKVPFDPPWLDQISDQTIGDQIDNNPNIVSPDGQTPEGPNPPQPSTLPLQQAPSARFGNARRALNSFIRDSNGRRSFTKAAGHYSRTGMGGARKLATRMRYSTSAAVNLAHFLSDVSSRTNADISNWIDSIVQQNIPSEAVIDAIINHVSPSSGSRDEESCANSMAYAMSEYLEKHEGVDLLSLRENDIKEITELFIAQEAYSRMINDIGQAFEDGRLSPIDAASKREEMREYLIADISIQIEALWKENSNPTKVQLDILLQKAIENTFRVYEGEL